MKIQAFSFYDKMIKIDKKILPLIFFIFLFLKSVFSFSESKSKINNLTKRDVDSLLLITQYDTTSETSKLNIYLQLFKYYARGYNTDSAKIFYGYINKMLNKIGKKKPDDYFNAVGVLFSASLLNDKPDTTLRLLNRALKVANKYNSKSIVGNLYFLKGITYWYIKDYVNSLKMFLNAEKIAEKTSNKKYQVLSYDYLGYIFMEINDFESAGKFLKTAIIISTTENLKDVKYYTLRNFGIYYLKTDDYEKSEEYFLKSIKGYEEIHDSYRAITLNYNFITQLYLDIGEYEKAADYLKKILTFDLDTLPTYFKAGFYKNLGRYYMEKGVYQKSLLYLKKYIDEYDKSYYLRDYDVYRMLANVYYHQGNDKLGFFYYGQSFEIMDSTFNSKLIQSNFIHSLISGKYKKNNSAGINDLFLSSNVSISDFRDYVFKTYKVYILSITTLIIIFILFLIIKLWISTRKNNIVTEDSKALRSRIKRLERTLKEVEEFSMERADLLQESISENNSLSKKYNEIIEELKLTYKELENIKSKFSYTVKGPVNNLINLFELWNKNRNINDADNQLMEKIVDIVNKVKWLIILNFGYEKSSIDNIAIGKVRLCKLLEIVVENLDFYVKKNNIKINKSIITDNAYISANDKILARSFYSLFVFFLSRMKNDVVNVKLSEHGSFYELNLLFKKKNFNTSYLKYLSAVEAAFDIQKEEISGNLFDLSTVMLLLKKMGFEVEMFYDENEVGFDLKVAKYEPGKVKTVLDTFDRNIKGRIIGVGFVSDEKFLISETLKSSSESGNYVKISWTNNLSEVVDLLKEKSENEIIFDLILLKVEIGSFSLEEYKKFLTEIRNIGVEYFKIPVLAVFDDFDENMNAMYSDYFSDMIFKPFDIETFLIKVKSNMKNTTYLGKHE